MLTKASVKMLVYFAVSSVWGIGTVAELYSPRQAAFWWATFVVVVILYGLFRYVRFRDQQFRDLQLRNPAELTWVSLAVLIAMVVSQFAFRFWR